MDCDRRRMLLGIVLLACLAPLARDLGIRPTSAQTPPQPLDIVGHLGGAPHDVVIVARHAYVATGYALEVWDIADPARPVRTGQLPRRGAQPPGWFETRQRLRVDGDRAVLCDRDMARIVDVSDPAAPREAGVFRLRDTSIVDAMPNGSFLYLAVPGSGAGVVVIDVSDPASPREVLRTADGAYDRYALSGHYLYAAGYSSYDTRRQRGLRIYDVSTPGRPIEENVAHGVVPAVHDLAIDGPHLYAATNYGLWVYDVEATYAVYNLARFATTEPVDAVDLLGGRAYITHGGLVEVVDVSHPRTPQGLGSLRVAEWQTVAGETGIAAGAGVVVATVPGSGVHVVDASDASRMSEVFRFGTDLPGVGHRAAVEDRHAYVLDGTALRVVDVSDPATPVARASYSRGAPGDAFVGLAVQGAIAYVLVSAQASDRQELHVLDVSDPASPRRVALLEMGDEAPHELLVRGGHAYVTAQDHDPVTGDPIERLRVLDVSDPTAPRQVGVLDLPGVLPSGEGSPGLTFSDASFVLGTSDGIALVDVRDPSRPALQGHFDTGALIDLRSVTAAGGYGYLSFRTLQHPAEDHIGVVALSAPTGADILLSMPVRSLPHSLALSADHLFAGSADGVQMYDNRVSTNLRLSGSVSLPALVRSLALRDGYACVADADAGLFILYTGDDDLPDVVPPTPVPPTPPTPTSSPTPSPTSNPTVTPTVSRAPVPTGTPTVTPGPTSVVTCVCRKLYRRVPPVVIADAVANPARFYGWGLPLNPNKPIGPDNPARTCLSLRSMSNPYHPMWNAVEWQVGCP